METQATQATQAAQTTSNLKGATASSDYQTFLNMLTVQMQNQDPLNPMDASDFAVQLATFSSVEQQTLTNQLLSSFLGQSGLADLGSWVGMEARIYGGAWFEGNEIELAMDPALGADTVILNVRNSSGAIVDTRELEPGTQTYNWDGYTSDGNVLPAGQYTFEIESRLNGDTLSNTPAAAYLQITEARYSNGATQLVLPGGLLVDASSVTGLRSPRDLSS